MHVYPESFVTSSISVEQELGRAGSCETCCNLTVAGQEWMIDYDHSLKKNKLKYWMRFKFGAGDPVVCKTAYFISVLIHGACAIMRVSVVSGKLMLLIGKDKFKVLEARFDLKNNIGIFPGPGYFEGKVLRESRAGHLMVPLLPESFWEFHDSFVPSETAGPWFFFVKRLPGSRTIRDLMITSVRRSFQRLHRTFSAFASEKGRCE